MIGGNFCWCIMFGWRLFVAIGGRYVFRASPDAFYMDSHYWIGASAGRNRSAGGIAFLPDAGNRGVFKGRPFYGLPDEYPAVGPGRPAMTGTVNNKIQRKKILWDS